MLISFCGQLPRPQRTQCLLLLCLLLLLPFAVAVATVAVATVAAAAEAPLGLLALIGELRCKFELSSTQSEVDFHGKRVERFKVSQIWCKWHVVRAAVATTTAAAAAAAPGQSTKSVLNFR